jgi:hypothetical protein
MTYQCMDQSAIAVRSGFFCLPQRRSSAFDETGVAELLHTVALNIIRRAISATIKAFPFR